MSIPADTLLEEAKCYLCLGISQAEALQLALLSRIASADVSASFVVPRSEVYLKDDFIGGGASGNAVGELGWGNNGLGTLGSQPAGITSANPGVYSIASAATANAAGRLEIGWSSTTGVGFFAFGSSVNWQCTFIFRAVEVTSVVHRVGLLINVASVTMTDGIFLRLDTAVSPNWFFVCRSGGVETATNSGIAANTNWHRLTIRSVVAGTIIFNFDGGADITIAANVPTSLLRFSFAPGTLENVAKSLWADFFEFRHAGLTR